MYKVLQHGIFKSMTRGYYTPPQDHLNFLLTRLNYLPGFVEAKGKNYILAQEILAHPIDLIENTLKQVFSSTHHQNALIALEKKQFSIHELLSVDAKTRADYLNKLENAKSEDIPLLSELKKIQDSKMSFCPDNAVANFTRPKI
jgi:hypothetical protein